MTASILSFNPFVTNHNVIGALLQVDTFYVYAGSSVSYLDITLNI